MDNAGLLQINDLVTNGKGELGADDRARDIVTDKGPLQAGDGAGQHTLHGLGGQGLSEDGLVDGHGVDAVDITKDDWGTDAAGAVGSDPAVLGEVVTPEALTKVGDHVVTLGLTVDKDIEIQVLLSLDTEGNLLLDELLVGSLIDLTLGELGTGYTDLLGLGEGTNGGGGEVRQGKSLVLLLPAGGEDVAATELIGDNGLETLTDGAVGGVGRGATGLDGTGIVGQLGLDRLVAKVKSLGEDDDFLALLLRVSEPVKELGVLGSEALLEAEGDGSMEERAAGGNKDAVGTEGLDGSLGDLESGIEVSLPDVAAIDQTEREDLGRLQVGDDVLKLLGSTDKVNVETSNVDVLDEGDVVADAAKVGGDEDLELVADSSQTSVGSVVLGNDSWRGVEDEAGLINLDPVGTGLGELGEELLVDGENIGQEREKVKTVRVLGSLTEEEEREGSEDDGAGMDAESLGLFEFLNSLGLGAEAEDVVVLELGDDVVVVGVEPLLHLLGLDIDFLLGLGGRLLDATADGKVALVAVSEVAEAMGDDVEHDGVIKNVIVEREVTGGDLVEALGLLELPVLGAQLDSGLIESLLGDLAGPEVLDELLGLALGALLDET